MKAFPLSIENNYRQDGMDLRDYFAAKALQGLLASSNSHQERFGVTSSVDDLVRSAYTYADAMMEARSK
jgi:hypothetical protein